MRYTCVDCCQKTYDDILKNWEEDKQRALEIVKTLPEDTGAQLWSHDGIFSFDPDCRCEWKVRKTGSCAQCENLRHLGLAGETRLGNITKYLTLEERENPYPLLKVVGGMLICDDLSGEILVSYLSDPSFLSGHICGNKGRLIFAGEKESLVSSDVNSAGVKDIIRQIVKLCNSTNAVFVAPHASLLSKNGRSIRVSLKGGAGYDGEVVIRRDDPSASAYLSSLAHVSEDDLKTLLMSRRLGIRAGGSLFDIRCFLLSLFSYPQYRSFLPEVRESLLEYLSESSLGELGNGPLTFEEVAILAAN